MLLHVTKRRRDELCGLCFRSPERAELLLLAQDALSWLNLAELRIFPFFTQWGPVRRYQRQQLGCCRDNPFCSLLELLVALLFSSPGSCKWLGRHLKQPSARSGPAFAACHRQHRLCHPKPGSAAQVLLRTFPVTPKALWKTLAH